MSLLEQLVEASGEQVEISKDCNNNFVVAFTKVWVEDGVALKGVCGRGKTIEDATRDFIQQISGKDIRFGDSERKCKFIIMTEDSDVSEYICDDAFKKLKNRVTDLEHLLKMQRSCATCKYHGTGHYRCTICDDSFHEWEAKE